VTGRAYEQRRRAESAAETRRRILDAVATRLREAPTQPVSVDVVARMAGVARSTVYVVFGSRAGLFDAFATDLFERAGHDRLVEAVQHPDAAQTLRDGFRHTVGMYVPDRDVIRALHSMAQLDPEAVGGAVQRIEAERSQGMATLARRLDEQGVLRTDVTQHEAANVMWLLTSFEGFDLLYTGRGLGVEEIVTTLVTTAERTLFRTP